MNLINHNMLSPTRGGFGNFFEDFFNLNIGDFIGADFVNSFPSVNTIENETEYKIEIAAPGLEKADFNIEIEKHQLTISASKETKTEDENFRRREFNYTSFKRSFHLPDNIKREDITAAYENGVLVLSLPKKAEEADKGGRKIIIE